MSNDFQQFFNKSCLLNPRLKALIKKMASGIDRLPNENEDSPKRSTLSKIFKFSSANVSLPTNVEEEKKLFNIKLKSNSLGKLFRNSGAGRSNDQPTTKTDEKKGIMRKISTVFRRKNTITSNSASANNSTDVIELLDASADGIAENVKQ
jgi:hypothetical protein